MKKLFFSIFAVALLCAGSCTAGTSHDSTPVAQLDLQRYSRYKP